MTSIDRQGKAHRNPPQWHSHIQRVRALLFAAFLAAFFPVNAGTLLGRAVGITDGDTITVLDSTNTQHKVRLSGIDALKKSQPFGQRSKQSLSDLVFGKAVTVETTKRNRYCREVGKVLTDGLDVNI